MHVLPHHLPPPRPPAFALLPVWCRTWLHPIWAMWLIELVAGITGLMAAIMYFRKSGTWSVAPFTNAISAALALSFAVRELVKTRGTPRHFSGWAKIYFGGQLAAMPVFAVIGWVSGAQPLQIVGDVTYLIVQALLYSVGTTVAMEDREEPLNRGLRLALLIAIPSVAVGALAQLAGIGFPMPNALVFAALLLCAVVNRAGAKLVLFLPLAGGAFVFINRSYLLSLVPALAIVFWLALRRPLRGAFSLLAVIAVIAAVFVSSQLEGERNVFFRLQTIGSFLRPENSESRNVSLEQRVYELERVWSELTADPVRVASGFGHGASLDMIDAPDVGVRSQAIFGEGKVHNIHVLFGAMGYRYGILGVAWALVLLTWFISLTVRCIQRQSGRQEISALWFLVLAVGLEWGVYLTASNLMFTSWLLPCYLGILDRNLRSEAAPRIPA